jgi:hypothetical protein
MGTITRCAAGMMIGMVLSGFGCAHAPPTLNSDLSPEELQAQLAADFKPGMTLQQVGDQLKAQNVRPNQCHVYHGPPVQVLARLFPRHGFWVDEPGLQDIYYDDVWFLFGPDDKLTRFDTERKRMRVQAHQWMDPPFHTPEVLPDTPRPVTTATGGANAE